MPVQRRARKRLQKMQNLEAVEKNVCRNCKKS